MNYFRTDAALLADAGKGDLRGGFAVSDDAFGQYPFAFVIFQKKYLVSEENHPACALSD